MQVRILQFILGILFLPAVSLANMAPRIDTTFFENSHQIYKDSFFTEKDMEKLVPTDLTPEMSDEKIASRIADRSLQTLMKSPGVQNSTFGKTAKNVEKATQADMTLQGSEKNSVEHKFRFQMLAFQSEAQIKYTGLMDASLTYEIGRSQIDLEIKEALAKAQEVVFNYQSGKEQTLNQILLRMQF